MSVRHLSRLVSASIALALAIALIGVQLGRLVLGLVDHRRGRVDHDDEAAKELTILVTNDDGVGAPGINTLVQALVKLPTPR